jgi:hypothetical protein
MSLLVPASAVAQQLPGTWAAPRTVYIPETGHSVDGYFLDVWRSWGIASLGYPVTPEITENGHIVQYYQYARLEYWPEDPNGDYVKFGTIGRELMPMTLFRNGASGNESDSALHASQSLALQQRAWLPLTGKLATRPNTATWRYVPETQHSIQHGFKDYWEATGEATYLGYPITEEYVQDGITYQVFEYGQLAWSPGRDAWEIPVGEVLARRYQISMEPLPQGDLPVYSEDLFIPPPPWVIHPNAAAATGEKWLEVDLSSQYMIVWQGNTPVAETFVSTGKPRFDTPPGNNFGAVMSHGCINLPVEFSEWLYRWSHPGMRVEIRP